MTPMNFLETSIIAIIVTVVLSRYYHRACGLIISVMLFGFWILNKSMMVGLVSHTSYMPYVSIQSIISIIVFTVALIIDFRIYTAYPDEKFTLATIILSLLFLAVAEPSADYLVIFVILVILGGLTYYLQGKKKLIEKEFKRKLQTCGINPHDLAHFKFISTNDFLKNEKIPDGTFIQNGAVIMSTYLLMITSHIPGLFNTEPNIKRCMDSGNVPLMAKYFKLINLATRLSSFKSIVWGINRSHLLNYKIHRPLELKQFYNKVIPYKNPQKKAMNKSHLGQNHIAPIRNLRNTLIGQTGENRVFNILKENNFDPIADVDIFYPRVDPDGNNNYSRDTKRYGYKGRHNSNNNQIDVLVVNNYGVFALEVKTYHVSKVEILPYGSHPQGHPNSDLLLDGVPNDFNRQLDNHVWALRRILLKHKSFLEQYGINVRDIPIHSPLIFVKQNKDHRTYIQKDPNARKDLNCIHYAKNPGDFDPSPGLFKYLSTERNGIKLNRVQVEKITYIIKKESEAQRERQQSPNLNCLPTFPHPKVNNYDAFVYNYNYICQIKILGIITRIYAQKFWDSIPIIKELINK